MTDKRLILAKPETLDDILALFKALTGREASDEEIAEVAAVLAQQGVSPETH